MPTTFRPYLPEQTLLLPPSLTDWLPPGHLAYFVSDTIEALDLSALYERYESDGRRNQPYDPWLMLKVLVYAYATGTFSSRRIASSRKTSLSECWARKTTRPTVRYRSSACRTCRSSRACS